MLRRVLKPEQHVLPSLPLPEANLQVPEKILHQRVISRGVKKILQALIKWTNSSEELATWEDLDALKQMFPRAPAWGQAVSNQGGIVSSNSKPQEREQSEAASNDRPTRKPRLPARFAGPEWALGLVNT